MIREDEVKKAFRIAYETLGKCGEPVNTPEYAKGVADLFSKTWAESNKNGLLKHLSLGIIEWLGEIAKGAGGE